MCLWEQFSNGRDPNMFALGKLDYLKCSNMFVCGDHFINHRFLTGLSVGTL